VSAGAGLVGLWGDVLSTHCEEAGDVISRRVNWPSAFWLADAACVSAPRRTSSPQVLGLCARQVDLRTTSSTSTVNGNLALYFHKPFCRWAVGAATVSGSDSWQRWGRWRL